MKFAFFVAAGIAFGGLSIQSATAACYMQNGRQVCTGGAPTIVKGGSIKPSAGNGGLVMPKPGAGVIAKPGMVPASGIVANNTSRIVGGNTSR